MPLGGREMGSSDYYIVLPNEKNPQCEACRKQYEDNYPSMLSWCDCTCITNESCTTAELADGEDTEIINCTATRAGEKLQLT